MSARSTSTQVFRSRALASGLTVLAGVGVNLLRDVVDVLVIAGTEQLDAAQLREALETTFRERGQQRLPSSLSPPPENWRDPYRRLATEVGVELELDNAYAEAAACLDPILAGRTTGVWDPQRRTWR